jgi:hypothetical protein
MFVDPAQRRVGHAHDLRKAIGGVRVRSDRPSSESRAMLRVLGSSVIGAAGRVDTNPARWACRTAGDHSLNPARHGRHFCGSWIPLVSAAM